MIKYTDFQLDGEACYFYRHKNVGQARGLLWLNTLRLFAQLSRTSLLGQ